MSFLDRYKDNKELFESLIPIILNFPPRRFLIFRSPTAVFFVLIWARLDLVLNMSIFPEKIASKGDEHRLTRQSGFSLASLRISNFREKIVSASNELANDNRETR